METDPWNSRETSLISFSFSDAFAAGASLAVSFSIEDLVIFVVVASDDAFKFLGGRTCAAAIPSKDGRGDGQKNAEKSESPLDDRTFRGWTTDVRRHE
jgi:hypothetical protein